MPGGFFDKRSAPTTIQPVRPARLLLGLLAGSLWALKAAAEPVPVSTVRLDQVLFAPVYSAPASVVARNTPQLAAEIDAQVLEVAVRVGDRIAAAGVVVRLDCRRHQSQLSIARAGLARAEARQGFAEQQFERARNLLKKNSISEEVIDQRRSEVAVAAADVLAAKGALQQATLDVEHCEIRAPVDGVVTRRHASRGDFAMRGTVMVELLDTAGQEVSVALRDEQASSLTTAQLPRFEASGERFDLQLRALLPAVDTIARTREARLSFTAQSAISGTAGRVVWPGAGSLLPPDYLVRRDGELGIFIAEDGHARFIPLPEAEDGRPVAVELPAATALIAAGRQRLADGDEVLIDSGDPEP